MQLTSFLTCLAAGSVATQALVISSPKSVQEVGIGFSLDIDYATAAIYYPDGTTLDLIKIEGSPKYRNLMKRAGRESLTLRPASEIPPHSALIAQTAEQVSLSDRLGHWFDVDNTNRGMADMFKTLKTATESFLEQRVTTVDVVAPFPISSQLQTSINNAYNTNTLSYAQPPQSAPELAAKYEGMTTSCSAESGEGKVKHIIAVDWNRAAFTMTLLEETCGAVAWRRILHDERLGDSAMRECISQYGEKTCDAEFIGFIRRAIEPLEAGSSQGIQTMLLVGEYSMSTKIMYQVKEQLKSHFDIVKAADPTQRFKQHLQSVNPVFAAARAAGWNSWMSMTKKRNEEGRKAGGVIPVEL